MQIYPSFFLASNEKGSINNEKGSMNNAKGIHEKCILGVQKKSNFNLNHKSSGKGFIDKVLKLKSLSDIENLDSCSYDSFGLIVRNEGNTQSKIVEIDLNQICFSIHFNLSEKNINHIVSSNYGVHKIVSGTYNILKWSSLKMKCNKDTSELISMDIFFKKHFIQQLLNVDTATYFHQFLYCLNNKNTSYWKVNKLINGKIKSDLFEIINCSYKGNVRKNYIESKIKILLIDLFLPSEDRFQNPLLNQNNCESLEEVINFIEENLNKKITIKELSEIAGFNTTKLKINFKKVYGVTIFKYISNLRMQKAKKLILEDNYTIAQVSYELSYSSPQHFTAAFKKSMGYLPSRLLNH